MFLLFILSQTLIGKSMLSWQDLSNQLQQIANAAIRFIKARQRENSAFGLAAISFLVGYLFFHWLPEGLQNFVRAWHGDLIIAGAFYLLGLIFLFYGFYRLWKLTYTSELPPSSNHPSAIKGPMAFTPADGELFRKLGREDELRKLLGHIKDDQVCLVTLMGASGAGKTSLLRAGLTDILKTTDIQYHYWETVTVESGRSLLTAIQQSLLPNSSTNHVQDTSQATLLLKSLDDLINPQLELGSHVIVLDQFEQLGANIKNSIFELLRKVARKAKPPYRVTWIIAFRREYRANWSDFMIPEHERGFYPPELSLRLFTPDQAREVISQLILSSGLSVEQKVVDNLIDAATVNGEISSVDIGIGLSVLSELCERQGTQTLTQDVYHFAGGSEGLLAQYIDRCFDIFSEEDRKTLLNAMLALRNLETNQRIAEGKTCEQLAEEIKVLNTHQLKIMLDYLCQRNTRLLEQILSPADGEARYRLPHERLIPALNRLAGKLIGELEETRVKFSSAFAAWKNNRASQYLLKRRILRLASRFKSQIVWGSEEKEKLDFLNKSLRRRFMKRILISLMTIIFFTWIGLSIQVARYNMMMAPLIDYGYSTQIYEIQKRTKILDLKNAWFDMETFDLLNSTSLENVSLKENNSTDSIKGLVSSLRACPNINHMALHLSTDKISDLSSLPLNISSLDLTFYKGIEKIPRLPEHLTALSLNLSFSAKKEFPRLPENLKTLSLNVGQSQVDSLPSFPNNLTELTIIANKSEIKELPPLPNTLKKLKLDFSYSEIKSLPEFPNNLTELDINLMNSQILELKPLPNGITKLSLDFRNTKLNDITKWPEHLEELSFNDVAAEGSFPSLPETIKVLSIDRSYSTGDFDDINWPKNLIDLTLNLSGTDMKALPLMPKDIKKLSLNISDAEVKDFSNLPNNLEDLSLDLSYTKVDTLPSLPLGLTKLVLNLQYSRIKDLKQILNSSISDLSLDVSDSQIDTIASMPDSLRRVSLTFGQGKIKSLPVFPSSLTYLYLNVQNSEIKDISSLQDLENCEIFDLYLTSGQRQTLTSIPKNVTQLSF